MLDYRYRELRRPVGIPNAEAVGARDAVLCGVDEDRTGEGNGLPGVEQVLDQVGLGLLADVS
ncbi:hypothetical protein, partial [Mycolicibacterium sp. CBMA 361]|uniref:hypothetical protein n=1 Tax=Mycolicibacterium sp. CBMA 361 TaxID=2606610 RepID=UPI00193D373A